MDKIKNIYLNFKSLIERSTIEVYTEKSILTSTLPNKLTFLCLVNFYHLHTIKIKYTESKLILSKTRD